MSTFYAEIVETSFVFPILRSILVVFVHFFIIQHTCIQKLFETANTNLLDPPIKGVHVSAQCEGYYLNPRALVLDGDCICYKYESSKQKLGMIHFDI